MSIIPSALSRAPLFEMQFEQFNQNPIGVTTERDICQPPDAFSWF
jgi:hypothetical protein